MSTITFQKTQTEAYQTSTNGAVALTGILVEQGGVEPSVESVLAIVRAIRDELFKDISSIVAEDNAMLRAEAASSSPLKTYTETHTQNLGGGGNFKRAGTDSAGGKVFSKEEGLALVLNFGKFKGLTVGAILDMPASVAEEFGYTTGPGRTWVEWLAGDSEPKRDFAKRAAIAALS